MVTNNISLEQRNFAFILQIAIETIYDIGILTFMEFTPSKYVEETETHNSASKSTHIRSGIFVKEPFRPGIYIMGQNIFGCCILCLTVAIYGRWWCINKWSFFIASYIAIYFRKLIIKQHHLFRIIIQYVCICSNMKYSFNRYCSQLLINRFKPIAIIYIISKMQIQKIGHFAFIIIIHDNDIINAILIQCSYHIPASISDRIFIIICLICYACFLGFYKIMRFLYICFTTSFCIRWDKILYSTITFSISNNWIFPKIVMWCF